jgi:hypothetical protein
LLLADCPSFHHREDLVRVTASALGRSGAGGFQDCPPWGSPVYCQFVVGRRPK